MSATAEQPHHFKQVPRLLTVAAVQIACEWNIDRNIARAEALVRQAATQGAQIVLLAELFETPYFCIEQEPRHLALARPVQESRAVCHFIEVARELGIVLCVSFFERAGQAYFNSVAIIDADGRTLGIYRAAHLPNCPGHQEQSYFSPGDTGFKVWHTRYARVGVGSAWDAWFPEAARTMALLDAEIFLFASSVGEVHRSELTVDTRMRWRHILQSHAAANMTPVVGANRCGLEHSLHDPENLYIRFFGSSFIADHHGSVVAEAGDSDTALTGTFDLEAAAQLRARVSFFRDRRPDLYQTILTLDGSELRK
jgi:N-carbamoylputrescine amidase